MSNIKFTSALFQISRNSPEISATVHDICHGKVCGESFEIFDRISKLRNKLSKAAFFTFSFSIASLPYCQYSRDQSP